MYSWGAAGGSYAADYAPLELGAGAHCLWLQNPAGGADGWRAAIGPGACGAAATVQSEPDFALAVFERTYPGAAGGAYPRTARWEWDLDSERQFIGVRCGEAWCAVMPAGASAPRTTSLPEPLRGSELPRLAVSSWSDAQHLAAFDSPAGRARPGPWGTVLSHPALHDEDPPWTEGILAAAIVIEDDGSAAYDRLAERFYLEPSDGSGRGDVILRFPGFSPNEAWYQQGPMRRRQAEAVRYSPAFENPVTGAARWRWRESDPELWMFCRTGRVPVA